MVSYPDDHIFLAAKEEYTTIKVPEGAFLLFRNIFHFGVNHEGCRWLIFYYLDKLGVKLTRKFDETFRWGDTKHKEFIANNNEIPTKVKNKFLKYFGL